MEEMWESLKKSNKPILIYGMGNGADKIIDALEKRGIGISGVFANDDFVRGQSFRGFRVMTYDEARTKFGDMIVLLSFGTHLPEVIRRIKQIAEEQELYAPDVPVAGNGIFDSDYASIEKERLQEALGLLSDEKSREVFREITAYKLDGRIGHLFSCETDDDENWSLLNLGDRESYMDIGAYNGDTIKQFLSYVGGYERIIGVEPEKHSFRKLCENTRNLENTELLNCAIGETSGTGLFESGKGRGSSVGTGDEVRVMSVDDISNGEKISFIKIDAEGQEPYAINGAKKTIGTFHPKMLIAAYHRVEDIFDIPLRVNKIYDGYKIYLRHTPCLPAWEVNYYFVKE